MPYDGLIGPGRGYSQPGPYDGGLAGDLPLFELLRDDGPGSAIANLSQLVTINGTTVSPTLRYEGKDATASAWTATVGPNMSVAGTGSAVTVGHDTMLTESTDLGARSNGGEYWLSSDTSVGDIGASDDVCVELILRRSLVAGDTHWAFGKMLSGGKGWDVRLVATTGAVRLQLFDGVTVKAVSSASSVIAVGSWCIIHCFLDISEGATTASQIYVNGLETGSGVDFSGIGDVTVSTGPNVHWDSSAGSSASSGDVAYAAMYQKAAWFPGGASNKTVWLAFAKERMQRLLGMYPTRAAGTATWTSFTRASIASMDKIAAGVRSIHTVAAGMPRVCSQSDGASGSYNGYLPEATGTNLILQNTDFATTWAASAITVSTDTNVSPDGGTTMDTLAEDGSAATNHFAQQSYAATSGTDYVLSVFALELNRSWLCLYSADAGVATAYFNLNTGAEGATPTNTQETGIEDWGNGIYRCWMRITSTSTASHAFNVMIAEADNDITFDGLTQDSIAVWGAQVEASPVDGPTSLIYTTTGTVTRVADLLYYKGDDGNVSSDGTGSMQVEILGPSRAGDSAVPFGALSDGGSSNDRIRLATKVTSVAGSPTMTVTADSSVTATIVAGAATLLSGTATKVLATWATDDMELLADNVSQGTDTSGAVPNDLDRIHIGEHNFAGGSKAHALVRNIKIWRANKGSLR